MMEEFCVIFDEDATETARNIETNYNLNHPSAPVRVSVDDHYQITSWTELLFKISLFVIPLTWLVTCALWMTKTVTKSADDSLLDQWLTAMLVFSILISFLFGCVFTIKSKRAYKFEFEPREPLNDMSDISISPRFNWPISSLDSSLQYILSNKEKLYHAK